MKKLWQISTLIFIFQMIAGGITYVVTGELQAAFFAAALAALVAVAASAAFVAVAAAALVAAALVAAAALAAFVAVAAAAEEEDDGPFWARVVCVLPLGVGTLIGGALILLGVGEKKEVVEDGQ